ncbi:hypothetical protein [Spongorhabdus nitratireducens]
MRFGWQLFLLFVVFLNAGILRADEKKSVPAALEREIREQFQQLMIKPKDIEPEPPAAAACIDPSILADEAMEKAKQLIKQSKEMEVAFMKKVKDDIQGFKDSIPAELQHQVDMHDPHLDRAELEVEGAVAVPSVETMDRLTNKVNQKQAMAEEDVEVKKKSSLLLKDPMLLDGFIARANELSPNLVVKRVMPGMENAVACFVRDHANAEHFHYFNMCYASLLMWLAFEQRRNCGDIIHITPDSFADVNYSLFDNPFPRPRENKGHRATLNMNEASRETVIKLQAWMPYKQLAEDDIPKGCCTDTIIFPESGYMNTLPPGHYIIALHNIGFSVLLDRTTAIVTYAVYHMCGDLSIKTLSPECAESFIIASVRWGQAEYQGEARYVTDDVAEGLHENMFGPVGPPVQPMDLMPPECRQQ